MNIGSGDNGEFTFLDILAVLSFAIGVANYEENMTQSDKQELLQEFNHRMEIALTDIHEHLSVQDAKIDHILKSIKEET